MLATTAGWALSRRVWDGIAGWLLGAGAAITMSVFYVGFTGRGPLTGSERIFNQEIPGYQGGTAVSFIVAFVLGLPLYMGIWSWYDHRRRLAEGLPIDDTNPVMTALHVLVVIVLVVAAIVLAGAILAAIIFGLLALFD
ncbi:MAG: hypothetical protein ACRDZ3_18730 [Acidimicrobiia bacterium]